MAFARNDAIKFDGAITIKAGLYNSTFRASGLSSGVYFYKILAVPVNSSVAQFSESRKMIILK